jgi:hypothetical protein
VGVEPFFGVEPSFGGILATMLFLAPFAAKMVVIIQT